MPREIKNIEEIKLMLPDYVMDKLNQEEKKIVDSALQSSPELRKLFEDLSDTFSFVGSVKLEEPPAQYWSTLLPRIHERIESKQRSGYFEKLIGYWKIAVPIAAVILIALVYYLVINKQTETTITKKDEVIQNDTLAPKTKDDNIKKEIVKKNDEKETVKKNEPIKHKLPKVKFDQFTDIKDNTPKNIYEARKKEEQIDNDDNTASDIEEESVFGQAAGGLDEETETSLNRLSEREEESLIKQLKNTNL